MDGLAAVVRLRFFQKHRLPQIAHVRIDVDHGNGDIIASPCHGAVNLSRSLGGRDAGRCAIDPC